MSTKTCDLTDGPCPWEKRGLGCRCPKANAVPKIREEPPSWTIGTQMVNGILWDAVFEGEELVALVNRGLEEAALFATVPELLKEVKKLKKQLKQAQQENEMYQEERMNPTDLQRYASDLAASNITLRTALVKVKEECKKALEARNEE